MLAWILSWSLVAGTPGPLIPPVPPRALSPLWQAPPGRQPLSPWSPNLNLIPQPENASQNETSVAQSGFRLVAAWNDYRGDSGVTVGVAFSRTAGTSWSPNQFPLENSPFPEEGDPVVAFAGGDTVYLVGIAFDRDEGVGDIVMSRSLDGGQTWGPVENLTQTPYDFDDKCWITAYHDTLLVVYASFGSSWGIHLLVSTDAGETWQGPYLVNWSGNGAIPRMDAQGRLYVLWGLDSPSSGAYTDGIWLKVSEDLGQSFGPLKWVANLTPDTLLPWRAPALPAFQVDRDSGYLYVAYTHLEGDSSRVYFKRSLDGGESFEARVAVAPNEPGHQIFPALAIDAEHRVHLFYLRVRPQGPEWLVSAWHVVSEDYGLTWSTPTLVSDTEATPAWDAFIGDYMEATANAGFVGLVWPQRGPFSDDVWFSRQVLDTVPPGVIVAYDFAGDTVNPSDTLWIRLAYPDPGDVAVVHLLLVDSLGLFVDSLMEIVGPETLVTWVPGARRDTLGPFRILAVAHDIAWNAGTDTGAAFHLVTTGVQEPRVSLPAPGVRFWPNPFGQVLYGTGVQVPVEVWDPQGRLVARLMPQNGRFRWAGRGFNGRLLPPGVYILRQPGHPGVRVLKLR